MLRLGLGLRISIRVFWWCILRDFLLLLYWNGLVVWSTFVPCSATSRHTMPNQPIHKASIYTVSQKKTSHFNFRHNFAICWDIFTIFEAPCSGLIAGWRNLLHTHHRCEAFTWRDVTHDVIQDVARSAHWRRISYHLTYHVWTHQT